MAKIWGMHSNPKDYFDLSLNTTYRRVTGFNSADHPQANQLVSRHYDVDSATSPFRPASWTWLPIEPWLTWLPWLPWLTWVEVAKLLTVQATYGVSHPIS